MMTIGSRQAQINSVLGLGAQCKGIRMKKGDNMSLLLDERPLVILPKLAVKVGLNEAIILQQIHYWCMRSEHVINGEKWFFKSMEQWEAEMPFFSNSTLKRAIKNLVDQNLIKSAKLGKEFGKSFDNTKWYTICTENPLLNPSAQSNDHCLSDSTNRLGQNDPKGLGQNDPMGMGQNDPNTNIKITTETTSKNKSARLRADIDAVWDYYDQKVNKSFGLRFTLRDDVKKMIKTRLLKNSVDDLKRGVDGIVSSDFHIGNNPDKKLWLKPDLIFRSDSQLENCISYLANSSAATKTLDKSNVCSNCNKTSNTLTGRPALCNECHAEQQKRDEIAAARRFNQDLSKKSTKNIEVRAQMPDSIRKIISGVAKKP